MGRTQLVFGSVLAAVHYVESIVGEIEEGLSMMNFSLISLVFIKLKTLRKLVFQPKKESFGGRSVAWCTRSGHLRFQACLDESYDTTDI